MSFKLKAALADLVAEAGADGKVRFTLDVPPDTARAAVYPVALVPPSGTPAEREEAFRQATDRINGLAFQRWYAIDLKPDQADYTLAIDVVGGRTCTLTAKGPGGKAIAALAHCAHGSIGVMKLTRTGGPIVVGGLPRGQESVIYVWSEGFSVKRVVVPAGDADHTTTVTISPVVGVCEVDITVVRGTAEDWRPDHGLSGVTLVSLDGQLVLPLLAPRVNGASRTIEKAEPQEFGRVPPGTYYAVGGFFTGTAPQRAVIERALAGEDLRPLGVPTIAAVEGAVAKLTVHSPAVEAAIFGGVKAQRP